MIKDSIKKMLLHGIVAREEAYNMFHEARLCELRGSKYCIELKHMIQYRMYLYKPWKPMVRKMEIRRIQRRLCHPFFRSRYIKMLDFLYEQALYACSSGVINNPTIEPESEPESDTDNEKDADAFGAKPIFVGDFDETQPYKRSIIYTSRLIGLSKDYPLIWFAVFVLHL